MAVDRNFLYDTREAIAHEQLAVRILGELENLDRVREVQNGRLNPEQLVAYLSRLDGLESIENTQFFSKLGRTTQKKITIYLRKRAEIEALNKAEAAEIPAQKLSPKEGRGMSSAETPRVSEVRLIKDFTSELDRLQSILLRLNLRSTPNAENASRELDQLEQTVIRERGLSEESRRKLLDDIAMVKGFYELDKAGKLGHTK